jgi:hypothetical protein
MARDGHEQFGAGLLDRPLTAVEGLLDLGDKGRQPGLLEDIRDPARWVPAAGVGSERLRGRAAQRPVELTHVARDPHTPVGPEPKRR